MIKTIASIFVSLFISLMILLQMSLPHHHHHHLNMVCVNINHLTQQQEANSTHKHKVGESCNHSQKNEKQDQNPDCCHLKEFKIFNSSTKKEELKPTQTEPLFTVLYLTQLLSFDLHLECKTKVYLPLTTSFENRYILSSSGLRAPPIC